jgi:hypothetical protein
VKLTRAERTHNDLMCFPNSRWDALDLSVDRLESLLQDLMHSQLFWPCGGLTKSGSAGADSFSRFSDSGRTTVLMEGTAGRL